MNKTAILMNGIIKENPVFVLLLGMCPVLAVTTQVSAAVGMGVATTFVLLCSNISISILRNVISDKVRIPCYIVFIAGFVSLVEMILQAYSYSLYQSLGIFLPLIAVNCIVFGRAEVFAKNNKVIDSALDAIGMGTGFTLALVAMASVREIFGAGTFLGMPLPVLSADNISVFTMAPGGFLVLAILIAITNKLSARKRRFAHNREAGCAACPMASDCSRGGRG